MDDFTMYGDEFQQDLKNLEKVLIRCQEAQLALSNIKCKMMQSKEIVLGHHVSQEGIKFDPAKFEVISHIPTPMLQKEVRIFLGHAGYYRRFIENFTKIGAPMFKLLTNYADFLWDTDIIMFLRT